MLIVAGADKNLENKDGLEKGGPKTALMLAQVQLEEQLKKRKGQGSRVREVARDDTQQSEEAEAQVDKKTNKAEPKTGAADDERMDKDCQAWKDCIRSLEMSPEDIRAEDWEKAQEYDSV